MAPIDDDTLDRLLTQHLSARLDMHAGRAQADFRRLLVADSTFAGSASVDTPAPAGPLFVGGVSSLAGPRMSRSQGFWHRLGGHGRMLTGITATAIAASLATLWVLPQLSPHAKPVEQNPSDLVAKTTPNSTPGTTTNSPAVPVTTVSTDRPTVRAVRNRVWDEGTVTPNGPGTPMRQMRYQQVEQYHWYDPDRGTTIDMVVPREGVKLYKLDTY